ncbi:hypothetical protein SBOR_6659 [Sclerotinia borealis F-4128]|uniref:Uncharacterized protein n=1 Tax=Sclerotinia borealis (strain F-4128) TaxID=1432307 RepID=W9CEH3_SCLBF|nr:hypothetical protein SBOR_6659 [Sclerotinia borealis F-4128]
MEPLTFFNRFSVLEVEDIGQDIEDEPIPQFDSRFILPHKRTSKRYHRYRHSHKEFINKKISPFLRIPRELRWMVLDELVALNSEIEISPSTINAFHALRLTTKGLREEVKGWAKKRPDIVNDFPYGYYIPLQTTFILKIDDRWNKRVKHKTLSGSHVALKRSKTRNGSSTKTTGIDYMTREQSWYNFSRVREPQKLAKAHLKFEILLSKHFASDMLGCIPQRELFTALSLASRYSGRSWASMRLFIHGSLDQISYLFELPMALQLRELMDATQKVDFDKESWEGFCDHNWPGGDYQSLEYPVHMTCLEDSICEINRRDETGADVYEFGGQVMAFTAKSAEEMRRGPVLLPRPLPLPSQSSTSAVTGRSSSPSFHNHTSRSLQATSCL